MIGIKSGLRFLIFQYVPYQPYHPYTIYYAMYAYMRMCAPAHRTSYRIFDILFSVTLRANY